MGFEIKNYSDNTPQKLYTESFEDYAKKVYANIPDRTNNIPDKKAAINAKMLLLARSDCPASSRIEIQKEIDIIKNEIAQIEHQKKMKQSIFPKREIG